MSGATIGGVVGAVVGSFFGQTQLGWMIGSAIGGYVDPEQIEGPRLKDARTQTSRDGIVIPFGWGTFPLAGNIIWQQPTVTEHKNTETQGKGGPEVTTYTYTRSYAVGLCEGPVAGLLQIKRNGKLVYDAREDAILLAEYEESLGPVSTVDDWFNRLRIQRAMNARFIENCEIYLGSETQTPDPTIESYKGIGNVPAYRGLAYIVVTDDDVTDMQGAIPQLEFVVVAEGTIVSEGTDDLFPGRVAAFVDTDFPLDEPESSYEFTGYLGNKGLGGIGGSTEIYSADTIAEIIEYFSDFDYSGYGGGTRAPSNYLGYSAYTGTITNPGTGLVIDTFKVSNIVAQPSVTDNEALVLVYNDLVPDSAHVSIGYTGYCAIGDNIEQDGRGTVAKLFPSNPGGQYSLMESCGGTDLYGLYPLCIRVTRKRLPPRPLSEMGGYTVIPDAPGYVVNEVGEVFQDTAYEEVNGIYRVLALSSTAPEDSRQQYQWYEHGPVLENTDPNFDSEPYWTPHYAAAVTAGTLPAGWVYSPGSASAYPSTNVTTVWRLDVTPSEQLSPDMVLLATIVAGLCERDGLTSDEYDVSDLTDLVRGFRVANEGAAVSSIAALMPAYFFDVGEWDGKVRFVKRGGNSSFAINGDDLVERDGDPFERERVQEAELLRRSTVGYIDPAAAYGPTTQKYERRAGTVQAKGEASAELPLTLDADTAATIAKKRVLVAWGEPEKQKCSLPYRLAAITPTDVGTFTDDDGEVFSIRVMQSEDDSGIRYLEASDNSAEVYDATASGVPPKPPTIGGETLLGPTVLHPMNLDSLRAEDNVPGIYIAVCGALGGWPGCTVELSRDGGTSYQPLIKITSPARLGYLTDDVGTASSSEPITVYMRNGVQISSVTVEQIANGANAFAVTTGGVSEIGQVRTSTALGDGVYELTDLIRGLGDSVPADHNAGDPFVMLDNAVKFVPLDASLAGQTLYMRAVTLGTSSDSATSQAFIYEPPTFVIDGGSA